MFESCDMVVKNQKDLQSLGVWVAERDPISNDQGKRHARHQAILNIWGPDATRVWPDIQHNRGQALFIPAFHQFLSHT